MPDYIPKVSHDDVLRVLARDFSVDDHDSIIKVLEQYGSERWHPDSHRVHLAILKLANGSPSKLQKYVDLAKSDFRDVLAPAEYPRFFEVGFVGVSRMKKPEVEQLQEDDWHQYQKWLNAK